MRELGHERFAVVGHDRGAYAALPHGARPSRRRRRLAVLDAVPIVEALERCDARFASLWWHWFFLGQVDKPAERVISADPEAWYRATPEQMGAENFADYREAIHDPATVHAMCEDYRAGLGIDRAHDEADRAAGRRVRCPTLILWSERDDMELLYGDPLAIWRRWTDDLRGGSIDCGHHMAEEAPDELAPPPEVTRSCHPSAIPVPRPRRWMHERDAAERRVRRRRVEARPLPRVARAHVSSSRTRRAARVAGRGARGRLVASDRPRAPVGPCSCANGPSRSCAGPRRTAGRACVPSGASCRNAGHRARRTTADPRSRSSTRSSTRRGARAPC